ncbi:MAG: hypothetical protein RR902_02225 [Oscillospiraceae bacterium]
MNCPLKKLSKEDIIVFRNTDVELEQLDDIRKYGCMKTKTPDGKPSISLLTACCDESECAWWDSDNAQCGIMTIAGKVNKNG